MKEQHADTRANAMVSQKRKKVNPATAASAAKNAAPLQGQKVSSAKTARNVQSGANDIDSIFAGSRKRAKQAEPASSGQANASGAAEAAQQHGKAAAAVKQQQPHRANQGSKDDIFAEGLAKGRRVDEEGLPVYSTEELNVGKGGNTAACPFDCECCF